MVEPPYAVVWTKTAQQHLRVIFEFISKDSPINAVKVVEEIVDAVNKVSSNPEF